MKAVYNYLKLVKPYEFLWVVVLMHLLAIAIVTVYFPFETRKLNNINVWVKPLKFLISVTLYLFTIPGLLSLLNFSNTKKIRFANILTLAMLVENICICLQAVRGQFSHYNISSAFNLIVFNLMGVFILINTIYIALLFIATLRVHNHIHQSVVIAFRYALFLLLFASAGGFLMIGYSHHSIGAPDNSSGMFFTNWNRSGGDLRIMHFFGIHALQILPLLALAGRNRSRLLVVHLPALLLLLLTVFVFYQALAAKPFLA